jgi:hypothetical protein
MLEYVFFHSIPFEKFTDYLRSKHLQPETESADGTYEVRLPEEIDDVLSDEIEQRYDELMEMNQALFESELEQDADNYHAAGVVVNLKDGRAVYADVDPKLLARVMEVLSPEELGQVVDAIVDAVESPDERTFCQRMRDE